MFLARRNIIALLSVRCVGGCLGRPGPICRRPGVAVDGEQTFIWPTSGRLTQPYGCTGVRFEPRRGSCAHFHGGMDIANGRGTPVRAAGDGTISHVGWDPWLERRIASWMVIINHGGGVQTMYAHLRDREMEGIRDGARVEQGQIIGLMDSTGCRPGRTCISRSCATERGRIRATTSTACPGGHGRVAARRSTTPRAPTSVPGWAPGTAV